MNCIQFNAIVLEFGVKTNPQNLTEHFFKCCTDAGPTVLEFNFTNHKDKQLILELLQKYKRITVIFSIPDFKLLEIQEDNS
mmetsp:Transcript_21282/g.29789  ORF Transcript_21282/g.29789 Transcript_21282/m.29789 type:complete len:81 (+) Transcript_21282:55-297(+)